MRWAHWSPGVWYVTEDGTSGVAVLKGERLILYDVAFIIDPAGQAHTIETGDRTTHCWARAQSAVWEGQQVKGRSTAASRGSIPPRPDGVVRVAYHPRDNPDVCGAIYGDAFDEPLRGCRALYLELDDAGFPLAWADFPYEGKAERLRVQQYGWDR